MSEQVRRSQTLVRAAGGVLPVRQDVTSASGATGDSTNATPEAGATILGEAANNLRAIIENLLELDLAELRVPA